MLVELVVDDLLVCGEHAEVIVLVHLGVVVDEVDGQHYYDQDEHYPHDCHVVLLTNEEGG